MPTSVIDQPSEQLTEAPGHLMSAQVKKDLLSGTSALALGVIVERACSFLANILAARFGGASNFGVYALAISTANNVSAYAAGGIGSTAIRFSGEHPIGSRGYPTLTKVLAIIATLSAMLATAALWLGADPIAHLINKQSLTGPLRWAALSAAGIIMLECCRGFLVGQRRVLGLLLLSGIVGIGYLTLVPSMAFYGPSYMIASQSAVTLGAVLVCVLCYRAIGLALPPSQEKSRPLGGLLKQVWGFGVVQLAGLVGMNAAGWWLTSLIAKSDTSLSQMGFFAVAHQLRNIVALGPSLLTEGSLAVMAGQHGKTDNTPENVTAVCTYACTFTSLLLAGVGTIVLPWGLVLLYGHSFSAASSVTAIALVTAVVHMGSGPLSARLSIVSIKTTAVINTTWAVFVAAVATLVLLHGGSAAKGAAVYLAGHLFAACLQAGYLVSRKRIARGTIASLVTGVTGALLIGALACWREMQPQLQGLLSIAMTVCLLITSTVLLGIGKRHGWLPSRELVRSMFRRIGSYLPKPIASAFFR